MNSHRYKFRYVFIFSFVLIIFLIPILMKYNLHKLKDAKVFKEKAFIESQGTEKNESISIHNIIEAMGEKDGLSIEEISIKEEFKQVLLSCDKDISKVKEILEELITIEIVKDIVEIDFNGNLWEITVVFNWIWKYIEDTYKGVPIWAF